MKLDPIHHQGLRIALGAFHTSPVTSFYVKAKEMSLKNRQKKMSMNYALKLKTCPENRAYSCVFEPPNSKLVKKSNLDLDVVDDTTVTDTPPWSQSEPQICLSLTKYKKDSTNPEVYKQAFLEITSRHPKYMKIYTDGSKVDKKVAAAAVSSVAPNSPFSCWLRDHCSVYTAQLQAILFAVKQVYTSQKKR